MLTASADRTARLWDLASGLTIRTLAGGDVVAFSPDGKRALTGGAEYRAHLWDLETCAIECSLDAGHGRYTVLDVAFSPDGKYILSASNENFAVLWEASTGREVRRLSGQKVGPVASCAFSDDGRILFAGGRFHAAKLWNLTTGRQVRSLDGWVRPPSRNPELLLAPSTAMSRDGRVLAMAGRDDRSPTLWDATTGKPLRAIAVTKGVQAPLLENINAVAFSPNGKYVATGGDLGLVRVFEVGTDRASARSRRPTRTLASWVSRSARTGGSSSRARPTGSEVRDYVIEKVQALTQGRQNPTSRRENLEFDFPIY